MKTLLLPVSLIVNVASDSIHDLYSLQKVMLPSFYCSVFMSALQNRTVVQNVIVPICKG